METWNDVSRLALELPETVELTDTNGFKWELQKKHFAWERPLRKRDLEELGNSAADGPILGVRVADLDEKQGTIGSNPKVFFTIPHFANFPAKVGSVLRNVTPIPITPANFVYAAARSFLRAEPSGGDVNDQGRAPTSRREPSGAL